MFEQDGEERLVAAARPVHPLGKCTATPSLLAYIITSKYADGLPLYRLEHMFKRLGHEISRTNMAHWIIRLDDVFKPLWSGQALCDNPVKLLSSVQQPLLRNPSG